MPTASPVSTPRPDFSGIWIPLITPFKADAVDHAALKRLVEHYRASGIAGLVVCGSTGEAAALDDGEQDAVLQTVMDTAPGLPVVMGVSGYHLRKAESRVRSLAGRGLAAILIPAPSYIRPSQTGLIEWFTRLADASEAPVIVYDIPYRTGARLELATLLALAAHPKIMAIKDCGGDAAKIDALIADGRLQVLSGEDAQMFSQIAGGGAGAIAASAHLQTRRFVELFQHLKAGRTAEAQALWEPLQPLIAGVFAEPNPGPLKGALALQGWISDELRSPMTASSAALSAQLQALDAALGKTP